MDIIHKTLQNHDKDNQYIFIDNFYYLEKDTASGDSNIITFSKHYTNFLLLMIVI